MGLQGYRHNLTWNNKILNEKLIRKMIKTISPNKSKLFASIILEKS